MKKSIFISSVGLLSGILLSACSSEWSGNDAPEEDIYQFETIDIPVTSEITFTESEGHVNDEINAFGIRTLTNIIKSKPEENIAFSPASAMMAIPVFHNAKMQVYGDGINLQDLISYDNIEDVNSACNKLMRFLPYSPNGNCDIRLANSVWLREAVGPQPILKDFLKSQYYAELYRYKESTKADCDNFSERLRKWIEIKTVGEIPNLTLKPSITSLYSINVTYFKGEWLYKFDPAYTRKAVFHSPGGEQSTDMMKGDFSQVASWEGENWEAVSLPFDGNYDLIFILPSYGTTLIDAVSALGNCTPSDCQYVDLSIKIPKFKIENRFLLNDFFEVYFRAEVQQIAKIEVDEDGAKAIAVTIVTDSAPGLQKNLVFDRPFLYALVNKVTGTALMMGAVNKF